MALTVQQQKALALDKNISVTAGAGSGKTKILVKRFLKIALQSPGNTRRILAITFTKKAAGEMAERIAEELEHLLKLDQPAAFKKQLLEVRDQLSQASISTIHGFCSRILREFPIEAGLAPDFKEMDEFQQSLASQNSIEQAFSAIDTQQGLEFQEIFSGIKRSVVQEILLQALKNPFQMLMLVEKFEHMDSTAYLDDLEKEWMRWVKMVLISEALFMRIRQLAINISAADGQATLTEKGKITAEWLKKITGLNPYPKQEIADIKIILEASEFFTSSKQEALKTVTNFGGKKAWPAISQQDLLQLSELFAEIAQAAKKHKPGLPDRESDKQWFGLLINFLKLYQFVAGIYEQKKQENAWIDFDDLQIRTRGLLINEPALLQKLSKRFRYIMVDEFQDTNALQWEIIELLAQNSDDKIFVVGDPKQSIYGFRDADIRIFKQVKETFAATAANAQDDGNIVFQESFRFLPRLNAFINHIFSRILIENESNPFDVDYQPLSAMRVVPETGWVDMALLDEEQSEAEYIGRKIAALIASKTEVYIWENQEITRPIQFGDIAILLRGRGPLPELEQSLIKYGIPYQTLKGVGYWQKQEVYDFYHLLRFINNPQDDFALLAVLRSKMILLSDTLLFRINVFPAQTLFGKLQQAGALNSGLLAEERKQLSALVLLLRKWLGLSGRIPLPVLMDQITDDLNLVALYLAQVNGEQIVANIEKLSQYAQTLENSNMGGLATFVHHMEQFIENELREGEAQMVLEDTASVKIMTIHASKGLQFPVVFLPYLNTNPLRQRNEIIIEADGLALSPPKYRRDSSLLYSLMSFRKKQKELAEAKRLFYVGVTRSSNRLLLSATATAGIAKPDSVLSWLDRIFDGFDKQKLKGIEFELGFSGMPEAPDSGEMDYAGRLSSLQKLEQDLEKIAPTADFVSSVLKPLSPGIGPRTFSPTRIMTFRRNKQEYYQKYHLGFFEDDYQTFADDVRQNDLSLLKGKIVHRYLELFSATDLDEVDLLDRLLFEFEVFDNQNRQRLLTEIKQLTDRVQQSEVVKTMLHAAEAQNEVTVTMRLGADYLTGTLDRIYRNDDQSWQVVDYKTNQISAFQVDRESNRYLDQMRAYALLLKKIYPQQKVYPVHLYFLHPDKLFSRIFTDSELEAIEREFIDIIEQIKTEFPIS